MASVWCLRLCNCSVARWGIKAPSSPNSELEILKRRVKIVETALSTVAPTSLSSPPNALHIFSSTTFPTVDSSATVLATACLVFDLSAAAALSFNQRFKSVNKLMRFYCCYCTKIHFNNLFLHGLRKSHCIRPSSGQAITNSAIRSKSLTTPGVKPIIHSTKLYITGILQKFLR